MHETASSEVAGKSTAESAVPLSIKNSLSAKPATRICITVPRKIKSEEKEGEEDCKISSTIMKAKIATPHATYHSQKISPTPTRKTSNTDISVESFSSKSLPHLPDHVIAGIKDSTLQFRTNAEPCALQLSPTGRLLAVAFTDGTVRLFDMTGRYKPTIMPSATGDVQPKGTHCSYTHQRFGAVAVQLEAKGVHRSLLLHVDVSPDSQWFFAGALRGSMEMAAIYIGDLEAALSRPADKKPGNLLDLVKVYTHSDAKLRGFEACTCFPTGASPQYLLLTGRGIKNCHVWRFVPPSTSRPYPLFEAIMNLPTNGTTVKFLHFQEKPFLQAVTKSDDMKVQVWDLRDAKTNLVNNSEKSLTTPLNRPSYQDVPLTEAALGVAGSVCLCGGSEHLFNTLSVVNLDDRLSHATELALPGTSTNRRRSRGDLQSVSSVATLFNDADHALLQLADDSLVWFKLSHVHPTLVPMTEPGFVEKVEKRKVQIRRVGYQGATIAVSATFDSHRGAGKIQFKILEEGKSHGERFWGYLGTSLNLASDSSPVPVPVPVQERENVDITSFGIMEDEDDGSEGSASLKISQKAPSITPSLSKVNKQSIVTPQVSELKPVLALEKTANSALRPLARKLTQTLPFVSAKKAKKLRTGGDQQGTSKKLVEKRPHLDDSTDIPRKKKAKVETVILEDLAAASILKSIGQLRQVNSGIPAERSTTSTQKELTVRPETETSFTQTTEKRKVELNDQSKTSHRISDHTAVDVTKTKEMSSISLSSMSPPVPRKKSPPSASDTLPLQVHATQARGIDADNLALIETAASQFSSSSPDPVTGMAIGDSDRTSCSDVQTLSVSKLQTVGKSNHIRDKSMTAPLNSVAKKQPKHSTDVSISNRRPSKIQGAAQVVAQCEIKASSKTIKKSSIAKRCVKYIEKLQIELDKLGPHVSRLLTAGTALSESGRIQGEHLALKKFAMKRALRMAISVLKSVHSQPTRLAWMEAKTFLEESLKDLNISWVSHSFEFLCKLSSLTFSYFFRFVSARESELSAVRGISLARIQSHY